MKVRRAASPIPKRSRGSPDKRLETIEIIYNLARHLREKAPDTPSAEMALEFEKAALNRKQELEAAA